jgi:hypothetical protein
MDPHGKSREKPLKKSFEMRFNEAVRCMELHVYDSDGMFPLMVRVPRSSKLYHIERTKAGKLKMSAF